MVLHAWYTVLGALPQHSCLHTDSAAANAASNRFAKPRAVRAPLARPDPGSHRASFCDDHGCADRAAEHAAADLGRAVASADARAVRGAIAAADVPADGASDTDAVGRANRAADPS